MSSKTSLNWSSIYILKGKIWNNNFSMADGRSCGLNFYVRLMLIQTKEKDTVGWVSLDHEHM